MTERPRVSLVDEPDRSGRSTATLLASLSSRLMVLHATTGADAIGALTAGYAKLGREVARTADGQRMLQAISRSGAGANGDRLWDGLLIGKWASSLPPTAVLDQLRNDFALLAAEDLDESLELPPMPAEPQGAGSFDSDEPATAAHYLLGMWAFAQEVIAGLHALVGPSLAPRGLVTTDRPAPVVSGPLLP